MSARAGDKCCFCGSSLVSDGERVFCASADNDGSVCVGRIRAQEDQPPARLLEKWTKVGRAILRDIEDRRGMWAPFAYVRGNSPATFTRMTWEIGKTACEAGAAERTPPGGAPRG